MVGAVDAVGGTSEQLLQSAAVEQKGAPRITVLGWV
jgi:hypothetical protein